MNQCNQLYTTPTYSNTNSQAAAPKTVASNGEPNNTFEVLSDNRIRVQWKESPNAQSNFSLERSTDFPILEMRDPTFISCSKADLISSKHSPEISFWLPYRR